MDNPEIVLRGRLNGIQRNRLKRLLDMMYSPRELSEEIGFNRDWVYTVYVPGGCPHERDRQRHVWINGLHFRAWFEDTYRKRTLLRGEAFCLTCRRAVPMVTPERRQQDGLTYYLCTCPKCGRHLARIMDYKRKRNDKQAELEAG